MIPVEVREKLQSLGVQALKGSLRNQLIVSLLFIKGRGPIPWNMPHLEY